MKINICSRIILVTACIAGCTDQDRISSPTQDRLEKVSIHSESRGKYFPINVILIEPGGYNAFTAVKGRIHFSYSIIDCDRVRPDGEIGFGRQLIAIVELDPNLTLTPVGYETPLWRVQESSRDEIPIDGDNASIFRRTFPIAGREDGVRLWISFRIDVSSFDMKGIGLQLRGDLTVKKMVNRVVT